MPRRSETNFTDAYLRALKVEKRSAFYDVSTPGLEIRVTPAGVKTWAFRYRSQSGRTVRLVLGQYPGVSLKDAREKAHDARRSVSSGGDPHWEKLTAAAEAKAHPIKTLDNLCDRYIATSETRNRASTVESDRQRISAYISPKLGRLELKRVNRAQVKQLVKDIGESGRKVTANRTAALLSRIFVYGRDELDLPVINPATGLQSTFDEESRARVLTDDELRGLWAWLSLPADSPVSPSIACALQLCALTLQRAGEVSGMHESELDLSQRLWVSALARMAEARTPLLGPVHVIQRIRRRQPEG